MKNIKDTIAYQMTYTLEPEEVEPEIEELEETVLRLHVFLKRQLEEHQDTWPKLKEKIEKKKPSMTVTSKQRIALSELFEYQYYMGKLMAYLVALERMGHWGTPKLIRRLRGMKTEGNVTKQAKHLNSWEEVGP